MPYRTSARQKVYILTYRNLTHEGVYLLQRRMIVSVVAESMEDAIEKLQVQSLDIKTVRNDLGTMHLTRMVKLPEKTPNWYLARDTKQWMILLDERLLWEVVCVDSEFSGWLDFLDVDITGVTYAKSKI